MYMSFWREVKPSTHWSEHKADTRSHKERSQWVSSIQVYYCSLPSAPWNYATLVKRTKVRRTISPALITGESIIKLSHTLQKTQGCVFNEHSTLLYKLTLTFWLFCWVQMVVFKMSGCLIQWEHYIFKLVNNQLWQCKSFSPLPSQTSVVR